jgi:hypothetical protein
LLNNIQSLLGTGTVGLHLKDIAEEDVQICWQMFHVHAKPPKTRVRLTTENKQLEIIRFQPAELGHIADPVYFYQDRIRPVPDSKSRNIPEVVFVRRWAVGVLGIWKGWDSWVRNGANGVSLQAT